MTFWIDCARFASRTIADSVREFFLPVVQVWNTVARRFRSDQSEVSVPDRIVEDRRVTVGETLPADSQEAREQEVEANRRAEELSNLNRLAWNEDLLSNEEAEPEIEVDHVQQLLEQVNSGDPSAYEELFTVLYPSIKQLASRQLRPFSNRLTFQTTELVNESYLELVKRTKQSKNVSHFMAITSYVMRRVLIDGARRKYSLKRGGGGSPISLGSLEYRPKSTEVSVTDWLELDQMLEKLEEIGAINARVVEARVFGGLSMRETAVACGVTEQRVRQIWRFSAAWLEEQIGERKH